MHEVGTRPADIDARPAAAGSILAFDFGAKRIGVAVGDTAIRIAHPLQQIAFEDNRRRLEAVSRLVDEWRPTRLVVGVPGAGSDSDHPLARAARRFAQRLSARFDRPVDLIDEELSSWEASRKLTAAGVPARAQKPLLDSQAACEILERWFCTNG
jgi:putative Holliday junction resolvase